MTLNRASKLVFLVLTSSTLILATGCQSSSLKPDLGRLAFWKKDDVQLASRSVPPPSEHFSPDRGGSATKQGSQTKQSIASNQAEQNLKDSVEAVLAEARRNKDQPKDLSRRPYSLDSIDSNIGKAKEAANDVAGNNALPNLKSAAAAAQNSFKKAGDLAQNPGKLVTGVQDQGQHSASQIAAGVTNGFNRQANNVATGVAGAAGDLFNAAGNKVQQTVNTVQENTDNSFQPTGNTSNPNVKRNPYLGALNDGANNFVAKSVNAAAKSGEAANEFVAQAVNNTTDADVNAPNYKVVSASAVTSETMDLARGSVAKTMTQIGNPQVQQSGFERAIEPQSGALQPSSGTLQPLNNQATSEAGNGSATKIVAAPAPAATKTSNAAPAYPQTTFGSIQPIQSKNTTTERTGALPAALLKSSGNFTPGSTKPLQPLLR